jgi:hypothetical protein
MGAQQGDQRRPVAASHIDDLAEGGPVVRGRERWCRGGPLAAHQRVEGRGPVGMLGEVLPEPAPETPRKGRLTGATVCSSSTTDMSACPTAPSRSIHARMPCG